jgi:hypothetical protein
MQIRSRALKSMLLAIGPATVAALYACTIPGGSNCETIANGCPSGQSFTIVWQGTCCGTQEIPGTCCVFYCEKLRCSSGIEVCSRYFISSAAGQTCQQDPLFPNNMICAIPPGGG